MKRLLFLLFVLWHLLSLHCQSIPVDSIVAFYKNVNIECYKERIHNGMQDFDRWLQDSLYKVLPTSLGRFFSPSNIDIRDYDVIHFVSLIFYNMSEYDVSKSIYDHVIIDSTRCVVLAPIDKKGKLLGLTDGSECYSYTSFTDKESIDYRVGYKDLKFFLKKCRKFHPDAMAVFSTLYPKYKLACLKNGRIYLLGDKPIDLEDFIRQDSTFIKDGTVKELDDVILPSYRASFQYKGPEFIRKSGHTPISEIRICP